MALIDESLIKTVGNEMIDHDHREFISLLNQLDSATNSDFPSLYRQLCEHTALHFERENQLMARFGFPAETEHKGEHQRVLAEFKQFKNRIDKGLIAFGRSFVRERLPNCFTLHTSTMDSALAAYIKTNQAS